MIPTILLIVVITIDIIIFIVVTGLVLAMIVIGHIHIGVHSLVSVMTVDTTICSNTYIIHSSYHDW